MQVSEYGWTPTETTLVAPISVISESSILFSFQCSRNVTITSFVPWYLIYDEDMIRPTSMWHVPTSGLVTPHSVSAAKERPDIGNFPCRVCPALRATSIKGNDVWSRILQGGTNLIYIVTNGPQEENIVSWIDLLYMISCWHGLRCQRCQLRKVSGICPLRLSALTHRAIMTEDQMLALLSLF